MDVTSLDWNAENMKSKLLSVSPKEVHFFCCFPLSFSFFQHFFVRLKSIFHSNM